jgi:hypothetical protein
MLSEGFLKQIIESTKRDALCPRDLWSAMSNQGMKTPGDSTSPPAVTWCPWLQGSWVPVQRVVTGSGKQCGAEISASASAHQTNWILTSILRRRDSVASWCDALGPLGMASHTNPHYIDPWKSLVMIIDCWLFHVGDQLTLACWALGFGLWDLSNWPRIPARNNTLE